MTLFLRIPLLLLSVGIALSLTGVSPAAEKAAKPLPPSPGPNGWKHEELRRFKAAEANQGVAADDQFLYVITNYEIGKYRKETAEKVGEWKGKKGGVFIHLNAGTVRNGRLYCAHSNYPGAPAVSSLEVWDTATMKHVESRSFGIDTGSLTWVAWREGHWYACFAHYAKGENGVPGDPQRSQLVKFDDQWRRVGGWVFPPALVKSFGANSSSGGAFGPEGKLFITGHDEQELYVLEFPEAGSFLEWKATIPISAAGQSFNWDPAKPELFYSINRKTREVIVSRINRSTP